MELGVELELDNISSSRFDRVYTLHPDCTYLQVRSHSGLRSWVPLEDSPFERKKMQEPVLCTGIFVQTLAKYNRATTSSAMLDKVLLKTFDNLACSTNSVPKQTPMYLTH